ncbi:MAG: hypothetical protein Q7R97_03370 [Candidatus Daviesbacteria bacterium]|nr:hypothetical protein [Candidatus Daviesbacteria bacterium]
MKQKTSEIKDKLEDLEIILDSDTLRKLENIAKEKGIDTSSLVESWITQKVHSNNL